MGYYVREPDAMFDGVRFHTKTSAEVREALQRKLKEVNELLLDREARVRQICETHGIDAEQLVDLMLQYQKNEKVSYLSYFPRAGRGENDKPAAIHAGVIANIVREKQMSESERAQLKKMELVLRNLRDTEPYYDQKTGEVKIRDSLHQLSDNELEYLGF